MLFTEVYDLADKVGAIDGVKHKLLNQPDVAAEKLAESLDELYKMFQATDNEIVRYLSLSFETDETVIQARAVLLGMEVGQSTIRMHEARGHCSKIKNIYKRHLSGWFDRIFSDPVERRTMSSIFDDIGTMDDTIVHAVNAVTVCLTHEAEPTLNFVDNGDRPGAGQRVRKARLDVKPARIRLTEAMRQLRVMQADFISASQTV